MPSLIAIATLGLLVGFDYISCLEGERDDDRCEIMMKKIANEDRAVITDNTASRLHSTWLSQQCELRTGSKYVIRKYSFFENGTFLLLRYHYAEESCSIATYTVVARGSIEISSLPSVAISGATEAKIQLFSVHLIPLSRQVAHKFGHKMNSSCGGIESKWRPYLPQLVYEHHVDYPWVENSYELKSNSLQSRLMKPKKRYTLECLESFDIDFSELRFLRIEIKRSTLVVNASNRESNDKEHERVRMELLLGEAIQNSLSQRLESANRLQSTALLRADTAVGCLICGSVSRATEINPPLFHQAPSFPAMIDGFWLSVRCESIDGGFWSRRFFRIYAGVNRWSGHWTYYSDSTCSNPLYMVTAAGNYVQRVAGRKRERTNRRRRIFNARNTERSSRRTFINNVNQNTVEKGLKTNQQRSNDRIVSSLIRKDGTLPSGTTELELRIIESLSIPIGNAESSLWSDNYIPRTVKAPATLLFKARVSVDWNGDYMLLLASWKDDVWNAPLRRCSGTRNYFRTENSLRDFSQDLSFSGSRGRYQHYNRHERRSFSSFLSSYSSASSSLRLHPILLLLSLWFFVAD